MKIHTCGYCGQHCLFSFSKLGLVACTPGHLRFLLIAMRSRIDEKLEELDKEQGVPRR